MATQITTANINDIHDGSRPVIRSSGGTLYAVIDDQTDDSIEVWKSSDGTSWTEQDTGNNPDSTTYIASSCAIDSVDIIHISYFLNDGKNSTCRYVKFHTVDASANQDTFQGDEQVLAADTAPAVGDVGTTISVDSSDIPHIIFIDATSNMGVDYDTLNYTNRIGGTWKARVEIEGFTAEKSCRRCDITISDENVPEVSYLNDTDDDIGTALGNQNDATSFELFDIETGALSGVFNLTSIAVDSSGNTYVSYVNSTEDLKLRKHLEASNWSTWETVITLDSTNNLSSASLAIDGTDTYVLVVDDVSRDIYQYKNQDARVNLDAGTYSDVKVKWSHLNNNQGGTQIDYLFKGGNDIFWNKIILTAPAGTGVKNPLLMGRNPLIGPIG